MAEALPGMTAVLGEARARAMVDAIESEQVSIVEGDVFSPSSCPQPICPLFDSFTFTLHLFMSEQDITSALS